MATQFHFFSKLPAELREYVWSLAFEQPWPGIQFFVVDKVEPPPPPLPTAAGGAAPARPPPYRTPKGSEAVSAGVRVATHGFWGMPRTTKTERLVLLVPSVEAATDGDADTPSGRSAYFDTCGVLNACRESRAAARRHADLRLGNRHLRFLVPAADSSPACIAVDVARDLVCLRPERRHLDPPAHGVGVRYALDVLRWLRVPASGHAATNLAIEYHPLLVTGTSHEYFQAVSFHRCRMFHPFLLEMLAHLKRETFDEADYPPVEVDDEDDGDDEDDEDFVDDDDTSDDGDADDISDDDHNHDEGQGGEEEAGDAESYDDMDAVSESASELMTTFEVNHPFNGAHYEFKGKFYVIDYSLKLKQPSLLEQLERCRRPAFVCGRKKFYKVAREDRFFDVGASGCDIFSWLSDLERDVLKWEYGHVPIDMPAWMINPMDSFAGTVGCSMYALACVESSL